MYMKLGILVLENNDYVNFIARLCILITNIVIIIILIIKEFRMQFITYYNIFTQI